MGVGFGFGGGGGVGVPCHPTPTDLVCGDLLLPELDDVIGNQLLSQGAGGFLQVLVERLEKCGHSSFPG